MTALENWRARLDQALNRYVQTPFFNMEDLARELEISERQLFRKVKTTTGMSPRKYLQQRRLQVAKIFLEKGKYTSVNETAYAIGYSNVGYFILQFEKKFGKKPLEVLREYGWR